MPRINRKILIAGSLMGVVGLGLTGVVLFFLGSAWFGLPVGAQGPDQPIAFPHTVHAGEVAGGALGLECTFCHRNVETGPVATIPSVQQCMFCHAEIDGTTDAAIAAIRKLQDASEAGEPINWLRVHRLPDHVQFVHDAHIRADFTCVTCHGEVAQMTKVKQVRALKMGDCVDCHRENNAPTDCYTCHY